MKAEKILFITQEINPYVPDSNLTTLGRDIPITALDLNREVRTFMPKWGNINERRNQLHPVQRISGMNLIINDTDYQLIIKVASIVGTRMQVYFIDDDDFFAKRLEECDHDGNEYTDNFQRCVFYARSVLETVKKLRWTPDIVHCQGWISSMVPMYLKTAYADEPCFRDCRVVYTVSPNKLTLPSGEDAGQVIAFRNAGPDCISEFGDNLTPNDWMKVAIKYSDGVVFERNLPQSAIMKYAKDAGKPIMAGKGVTPNDYIEFFDQVWSENRPTTQED